MGSLYYWLSMHGVRNLIFDLGGVILDLHVDRTLHSFAALSAVPVETVLEKFSTAPGFLTYEKGMIDDAGFRTFVRDLYGIRASDAEIDTCWNAMLGDLPTARLQLLLRLKERYRVFLLSNTNEIHLRHINGVILPGVTGEHNLDVYFHRAYYSHRMLKRKPEPEIFLEVIQDNNLVAAETVFVDDNAANVNGARQVGLQAVLADHHDFVINYFKDE